jgi:hypothetical protein
MVPHRAAVVVIAAALLVSCGGTGSTSQPRASATTTAPATTAPTNKPPTTTAGPCGVAASAPSTYQHVVWIWMENHNWQQVLGDPSAAPYETRLAHQCATATHYSSVGSPSLPNYLGATSGDTWGIRDDADPSSHHLTVDNLFRQVRTAGGTERSYEEAMASPCQQGSGGTYAVRHNPAAYYTGNNDRTACAADDLSLNALAADLAAGTLPTFAFVTPDLCHDTHDCSVATGDTWLATWVPRILASAAYRQGSTAVFVMWDEYTPMPNLVIAPSVPPGVVSGAAFDHYSLLRTTEQLLGLPPLGRAATATPLRDAFRL